MAKKKHPESSWMGAGQQQIMEEWDAIAHALCCGRCGLRFEALLALAMNGWDEGDFWAEVVTRGLV